ncbi:uncharacterized protein LDX57_003800 [Aspergillus melleus]|uniref:uncharacterized protein n=1 Tax=Aspergillus melleus TaxID=138277 RepID=UPI001E8D7C50|nr:uncharacterized protein LDX57_003800 [Aspergillus melleus]KAH8426060.1 hypothetical protein LDX57_003800 [Aspergillus melleus]
MEVIRRSFVLLLGLGASFASAQKLHSSCADLKGKNSEGVETNYGDVRGSIAVAIQEVGAIAETARDYMKKAADKTGDDFDITRTVQSFYAFQGEKDGDESTSEGRWDTAIKSLERLMNYVENRNTQDPPFLCGDGHLTKFTHYQNGERIQAQDEDGNAFDTYMYFDGFSGQWWAIAEPACEDDPGTIAITHPGGYIQVCPAAFSFAQMTAPRDTIDSDKSEDSSVDWSDKEYEGDYRQSLDYWATPLSYSMFHELTHFLLGYDDHKISEPVSWIGGTVNKAYKFNGATQLVKEDIDKVSDNVDSLGMMALSLFMKACNWSSGRARGKDN